MPKTALTNYVGNLSTQKIAMLNRALRVALVVAITLPVLIAKFVTGNSNGVQVESEEAVLLRINPVGRLGGPFNCV